MRLVALFGAAALVSVLPPAGHRTAVDDATLAGTAFDTARRSADFAMHSPSSEARFVADWVTDSHDNKKLPFVILDKRQAQVFVFDANGRLIDASPVLLGSATGDDTVPDIGSRPIAQVLPEERTTPAGRFVSEPGQNASGEDIVWIDYDAAVSMHRVRTANPTERRLERLASPNPIDRRISYGCVNVPVAFYESVVRPVLGSARGVVYVLPETRALRQVFSAAYPLGSNTARYRTPSSRM